MERVTEHRARVEFRDLTIESAIPLARDLVGEGVAPPSVIRLAALEPSDGLERLHEAYSAMVQDLAAPTDERTLVRAFVHAMARALARSEITVERAMERIASVYEWTLADELATLYAIREDHVLAEDGIIDRDPRSVSEEFRAELLARAPR